MSIISIQDSLNDQYEKLLFERDALRKDAASIQLAYIRTFGLLINEAFAAKIACIRLKKQIAFYQAALNQGKELSMDEVDQYTKQVMQAYQKQLHEMYEKTSMAMQCKVSSEATVLAVKQKYRQLAKQVHPDLHPEFVNDLRYKELWSQIVDAYHANDLSRLEELEFLMYQIEMDHSSLSLEVPNIQEKIHALQDEIPTIISNDPYQYHTILENDDLKEEKVNELKEEIKIYSQYKEELQKVFEKMITNNEVKEPWQTN